VQIGRGPSHQLSQQKENPMGIETEQRLRQLEQRLAALESGVRVLQGLRPDRGRVERAVAPPPAKPASKTTKTKAAATGAKGRA
jgi:hypothetical protein